MKLTKHKQNLLLTGLRQCRECGHAWEKKEGHCYECGKDLGRKKGMWLPFDSYCSDCLEKWMNEQQKGKIYVCEKCNQEGPYEWVNKHIKKISHRHFLLKGTKEGLMFA